MTKFPQEVINTLWPIVSINAPGAQQSSLNSLKTFKHIHGFVIAALDQDLGGGASGMVVDMSGATWSGSTGEKIVDRRQIHPDDIC